MQNYVIGAGIGYFLGPAVVKSASFANIMKKIQTTTGIEDSNMILGGAAVALYLIKPLGDKNPLVVGALAGAMFATMQ